MGDGGCLYVYMSVCMYVCLSICLSVGLSVCLSVHAHIWQYTSNPGTRCIKDQMAHAGLL